MVEGAGTLMNALSWYRLGHWCYQQRIPLVPTLIKFGIGGRSRRWGMPVMEDRDRIRMMKVCGRALEVEA
jgi:hypothetical protein